MAVTGPIRLTAPGLRPLGTTSPRPFVARVTDGAEGPSPDEALLVRGAHTPPAFRAYFFDAPRVVDGLVDAYVLSADHAHLAKGDVVYVDPERRRLTSIYRRASPFNALLVTERCDNYCLMCSQPPKDANDDWLVDVAESAIRLMSPDTEEICITGGEPALLGARLPGLLAHLRDTLPRTAVHVLTNGRAFRGASFAREVARVAHPDLMLGIPLYSDLAETHDYVVQARGAYDDTLRGILQLKRAGVRVEIRVVLHRETIDRLPEIATFLARNLRFVDHVALMGLELMGFARTNLETLWVDPVDYQPQLVAAVETLARAGMRVSIYNHPLCVLDARLRPFARKSISDWKNEYVGECSGCAVREACCGFFVSSRLRRSRGIQAVGDGVTRAYGGR